MKSLFPVICTDDVKGSSDFYQKLLGLEPVFEADWYVQLQAAGEPTVEIAFVQRTHPSVPQGHQNLPAGVIVTLQSDDVDEIHARAESQGLPIVLSLRDEAWGQRHFMTRDSTGLLLDIFKLIPAAPEYAASYEID